MLAPLSDIVKVNVNRFWSQINDLDYKSLRSLVTIPEL